MANILGMVGALASAGSAIYGAIRSKKAAKEQVERQKQLQEHAREQQLQTWKDTNYPAQKKQLQEAGLNAGLLYGMGGTGGATTGSVGAGSAAMENVYDIGQGINRAAATAQIEATRAQTEKTKAETAKIEGVDTEKTKADAELAKISTRFKTIETGISEETRQYQIEQIVDEAKKINYEAYNEGIHAKINEETYQARIQATKEAAIGAMLSNQLTNEQIKQVITGIEQRYEELRLQGQSINQSKYNTEKIAEAMLWGAGINAAGNIVNNVIDVATMPKKLTGQTVKEVIKHPTGKETVKHRTTKQH